MASLSPPQIPGPPSATSEDRLRLLIDTGLLLASERSLDTIAHAALHAGLRLAGAALGAFFYTSLGDDGESFPLYKLAGLDPADFRALPMPRAAEVFAHLPASGRRLLRSADLTQPPDAELLAPSTPFRLLPAGHPPIRSYLAIPICTRAGEVLGGLLYAHPDPGVFHTEHEDLVATVASQAAIALENVRLSDNLSHEVQLSDAARALQRQTADRLRQALEAAHLGTWSWDRQTDLLELDERAARMFGVDPGLPITRTALRERIVLIDDRNETAESLQRALQTGGFYHAEYRVDIAGVHTWVAASGLATFPPGSSEITGMIGTVQDITARKLQEQTLRQSEKLAATGRLAATIAHEINNPLEAVINLIYLCRTDPAVPSHAQRLLETADNELARVSQIAQQTLGFYRDTTRPVEIDLNRLLQSTVDLFERKLLACRITCTLDLDPHLRLFGLQGEVRQVFSNLLVNAIDASPTGSAIRIRARLRLHAGQPLIVVLLADQGTGIPAAVRSQLFAPFFTTKQSVGTGLGLWVTRGIVEKQGGSITFRTRTGARSGTVFRVALPALPPLADSSTSPRPLVQ